jgi:hypothetical protein
MYLIKVQKSFVLSSRSFPKKCVYKTINLVSIWPLYGISRKKYFSYLFLYLPHRTQLLTNSNKMCNNTIGKMREAYTSFKHPGQLLLTTVCVFIYFSNGNAAS